MVSIVRRTHAKNGNVYIVVHYRDGHRVISKYCGIEGRPSTDEKIKEVERVHREMLIARMAARFNKV